jgi:nucleotide-binding universal stress UspA family protein
VFGPDDGPPLEVVPALTVELGLEEARARHGATGVIVARASPRGGVRPARLGPVARGLLRRLASPVIVCPPDLAPPRHDRGAVVAIVDEGLGSLAACRLARAVANAAGRELAIAPVEGDAIGAPLELAEARGAPLVAVGVVRRPGVRGAVVPRLARKAAASAPVAVLVVPTTVEGAAAPLRAGDAIGQPG